MASVTSRDTNSIKKRFGLSYQVDALDRCDEWIGLAGRRVLEVGGALPAELVVDYYKVRSWVSVDDRSGYARLTGVTATDHPTMTPNLVPPEEGWFAYDGRCNDLPRGFERRFDVAFCIATLEHVAGVPRFLDRLSAALIPGGAAMLLVGPVWSGWRGYHVYPDYFHPDEEKTRDLLSRLLPWQHLLMPRLDFHKWLKRLYGGAFADRCWESIFESPRLNRLFYDDFLGAFADSHLSIRRLQRANSHPCPEHPEHAFLLNAVWAMYPGRKGFNTDCFWVVLDLPRASPD